MTNEAKTKTDDVRTTRESIETIARRHLRETGARTSDSEALAEFALEAVAHLRDDVRTQAMVDDPRVKGPSAELRMLEKWRVGTEIHDDKGGEK